MSPTSTSTEPSIALNPALTPEGGRVQLALNVADVDAAVEFYSKLFGTQPGQPIDVVRRIRDDIRGRVEALTAELLPTQTQA